MEVLGEFRGDEAIDPAILESIARDEYARGIARLLSDDTFPESADALRADLTEHIADLASEGR